MWSVPKMETPILGHKRTLLATLRPTHWEGWRKCREASVWRVFRAIGAAKINNEFCGARECPHAHNRINGGTFRSYQSREVICGYAREYRLCICRWDGCVLAFVGWVEKLSECESRFGDRSYRRLMVGFRLRLYPTYKTSHLSGTVLMKLSILVNTVTLTHSGNYTCCAAVNDLFRWFITSFQFH